MLKIDIISGFLGAGKTTFIKRLLSTDLTNEKIVLIENEFGEISVDSLFLADSKIDIKELSQGCICCSLVGDFAKSLNDVIAKYNPDRIIIEPSGVGKLSDVIKAIEDCGLSEYLNTYVALVDSSKAKVYAKNFKEFFADQIANAKTVVLSRTDVTAIDKINSSLEVVRSINDSCVVIATPIAELSDEELLSAYEGESVSLFEEVLAEEEHHHHDEECSCECHHEHEHHHHHDEECNCGCHHDHEHHHHHDEECSCECHHEHEHHHHDKECSCECHHEHEHHHHHDEECNCGCHHDHEHHHHHDEECSCGCHHDHHHAHDVFDSVSIETAKVYCFEDLKQILNKLAYTEEYGMIIRAKGIVKTNLGWKKFNITPDELLIEDNNALVIGSICVIGVNISSDDIKYLF